MDTNRFDSLTKALASGKSRRSVLKGLLGLGGAAAVTTVATDDAAARRRGGISTSPPPSCPDGQDPCPDVDHCCPIGQCAKDGTTCCGDSEEACTGLAGALCCELGACARDGNVDYCCEDAPCGLDCCTTPEQCCDGECCPDGAVCLTKVPPGGESPGVEEEVCCFEENLCLFGDSIFDDDDDVDGFAERDCCTDNEQCCSEDGCCAGVCFNPFPVDIGEGQPFCCPRGSTICAGEIGIVCVDLEAGECCADSDCSGCDACIDNVCQPLCRVDRCCEIGGLAGTRCLTEQDECCTTDDCDACSACFLIDPNTGMVSQTGEGNLTCVSACEEDETCCDTGAGTFECRSDEDPSICQGVCCAEGETCCGNVECCAECNANEQCCPEGSVTCADICCGENEICCIRQTDQGFVSSCIDEVGNGRCCTADDCPPGPDECSEPVCSPDGVCSYIGCAANEECCVNAPFPVCVDTSLEGICCSSDDCGDLCQECIATECSPIADDDPCHDNSGVCCGGECNVGAEACVTTTTTSTTAAPTTTTEPPDLCSGPSACAPCTECNPANGQCVSINCPFCEVCEESTNQCVTRDTACCRNGCNVPGFTCSCDEGSGNCLCIPNP